jgi:hypothetical protein
LTIKKSVLVVVMVWRKTPFATGWNDQSGQMISHKSCDAS